MTFSVVNPGKLREVFCLWNGYGPISGALVIPRGRLWLLAETEEPDALLVARVGSNHPQTGRVVYEDLGEVLAVELRAGQRVRVRVADGRVVSQILAPCVCGAGAVGYTGPIPERHHLRMLAPYKHVRVTA